MMSELFAIIGMLTVAVIGGTLALIAAALVYAFWTRAFGRMSDYFFDKDSVWKMRVAAILSAISVFKFHKIPAVWVEAKEMVEEND